MAGPHDKPSKPSSVVPDGPEVARRRVALGWNQDRLAKKAKLSESTIEAVERASRPVQLSTLASVAAALEVPLAEIVADHEKPRFRIDPPVPEAVAARPGASPLCQLPSLVRDFVGRDDELRDIARRLRAAGAGAVALHGMGGIGKTTLAVRVAHEVEDRYPDGLLYLDLQGVMETPMATAEAAGRILRSFHPERTALPESESELLSLYRSTLAGRRALIVLDNAAGERQVGPLLGGGDRAGFLITSRNELALDGVPRVRVGLFSPAESLTLLQGVVGGRATRGELAAVAELCDHLPLALRVAGDFLRLKLDWTVAEYLAALNKERLLHLRVGDDNRKNVEHVLKLSATQLVRDAPDLARRWHYLSDWEAAFDRRAASAAWDRTADDEDATRRDLSELVARSLVLFDETSFRYRIHDLMKPIAAGLYG